MKVARFAGWLALLAGCTGPTFVVQEYPGPPRPASVVAVLRVDGDEPVQVLMLDGERTDVPVAEDSRLHLEMLPGEHRVLAQNLGAPEDRARFAGFRAEAGRVYRPVFVVGALHIYEVDRGSDAVVADVTLPPPSEPPPSPRPVPRPLPAPAASGSAGAGGEAGD